MILQAPEETAKEIKALNKIKEPRSSIFSLQMD
jgi:hypothetical protein